MATQKIRPRSFVAGHKDNQRNSIYKFISNQRFLALVGLILLFVILFPLARTYSQRKTIEKEIADVEKEISQYERDNEELKEMLAYLESEQSLEAQARINLNLKKPGETVVVIENNEKQEKPQNNDFEAEEKGSLQKWFDYFFK